MNTYVAFYNKKQTTVQAETKLKAQIAAAAKLGAKKTYQVAVELAELDGKPYLINTAGL